MSEQIVSQKIDEIAELFSKIQHAESQAAATPGGPYGSDLSELIKRLKEKLAELGIQSMATEGIHMALHYAIETFLPKLAESAPLWQKIGINHFIIPLLTTLDKRFHPEPAPPTT